MTATEIWLRLSGVKQLPNARRTDIAARLQRITAPGKEELLEAGLLPAQAEAFLSCDKTFIENALAWLEQDNRTFIPCDSPAYPPLLKNIHDFPAALFVQGDPALLASPQIAIVGSRNCSAYGRNWGTFFAESLAVSGLTITSGLALGIDGIAHRAALEAKGKTLAVLGSGLQRIYPRQHLSLAKAIVAEGGALVSEFLPGAAPLAWHFPWRNRIISELSLGVLVVEAALKSGSLVTARLALEQNRNVFALPGAIGNPGSEGTHWLIQQGALLTAHPNTILEELQSDLKWLPLVENPSIYSSDDDNSSLPFPEVLANVGDEVTPVDVVAERACQPVPAIVAKLLELELAGWIAAVPGGYVRLRRASHVRRTDVFI